MHAGMGAQSLLDDRLRTLRRNPCFRIARATACMNAHDARCSARTVEEKRPSALSSLRVAGMKQNRLIRVFDRASRVLIHEAGTEAFWMRRQFALIDTSGISHELKHNGRKEGRGGRADLPPPERGRLHCICENAIDAFIDPTYLELASFNYDYAVLIASIFLGHPRPRSWT
jgi:hypothetical protein